MLYIFYIRYKLFWYCYLWLKECLIGISQNFIKTLGWNVLENHISCFVVEFVEEVFPLLNIKEPQKKKGRGHLPVDPMFVYLC